MIKGLAHLWCVFHCKGAIIPGCARFLWRQGSGGAYDITKLWSMLVSFHLCYQALIKATKLGSMLPSYQSYQVVIQVVIAKYVYVEFYRNFLHANILFWKRVCAGQVLYGLVRFSINWMLVGILLFTQVWIFSIRGPVRLLVGLSLTIYFFFRLTRSN